MAAVFLGRKTVPGGYGPLAAIKVMLATLAHEADFIAMFADEAKILSRLSHPNISRTLEVGHDSQLGYIAMELLLGRTLGDVWDAAKAVELPFRFDLAAWICAEVARGLHYAHELTDEAAQPLNIVHRDVNPSNVFLTYDGAIKLFDFGLAKAKGRRTAPTQAGIVKGKVSYLSPEQLVQLPLDRRSDVFSLGTTLWELTTLHRLFKRERDLDTILAIRDGAVPDPRTLVDGYPDELWSIVRRSLAANRDERYATAGVLAAELTAFVGHQGTSDLSPFVGAVLDRLFPGERERQRRWLEEAEAITAGYDVPTLIPPAPVGSVPAMRLEVSAPLALVRKKPLPSAT